MSKISVNLKVLLFKIGWYNNFNHILSVWGSVDCPVSIYSCIYEKYYPKMIYSYVKGTDICAKFDVDTLEDQALYNIMRASIIYAL